MDKITVILFLVVMTPMIYWDIRKYRKGYGARLGGWNPFNRYSIYKPFDFKKGSVYSSRFFLLCEIILCSAAWVLIMFTLLINFLSK